MATAKKAAGAATEGLRIHARPEAGIRRAGRHWSSDREGTLVSLADLTPEQVKLLRDEPQLIVVDEEIPAAEAPKT